MSTYNIYDAKTQLSKLVDEAAAGEEVIIARHGRPLVRMVPVQARREPRRLGIWEGKVRIAEDFDELPDEVASAFRGERS